MSAVEPRRGGAAVRFIEVCCAPTRRTPVGRRAKPGGLRNAVIHNRVRRVLILVLSIVLRCGQHPYNALILQLMHLRAGG